MNQVSNKIISIESVTQHPRNYNTHDAAQIGDLRLILRKFGQVRSVVVQERCDGLGYLMVAGNGLSEAAKAEGLTTLKADVIPADWSETKVLAYLAADNELAKRSTPDEDQLSALVSEVENADSEMALLAAGSADRLAEMMLTGGDAELNGLHEVTTARELGDKRRQIKPVIYCEDLATFERAILKTGMMNRGEALIEICKAYLNGGSKPTKRQ